MKKFINNLKKEYNKIYIDKNAINSISKGIKKAKFEKKKVLLKNFSIGIACTFLTIFILPNINNKIAIAMEKIPILDKIVDIITINKIDENINVNTPKIVSDEKEVENLNKTTETYINNIIETFKLENNLQNAKLDINYNILLDTDKLLTIEINALEVKASGYEYLKIYNIDKKNGEILNLKDIFKNDIDYVKILSDNIKNQMRIQMKEDENKIYMIDSDMPDLDFKNIKENQNFYFNKNNELVICFDEYEVAPGYMGKINFIIPKTITDTLLKNYFK